MSLLKFWRRVKVSFFDCEYMTSSFGLTGDTYFMNVALQQAMKAFKYNEVPVGAVVVGPDGAILSRGYNQVERRHMQLAHAELIAIQKATKKLHDWRLLGCWIYVTLEPCAMCMAAIKLSRCAGVVYGADSPQFGYQLIDKDPSFKLYKENVVEVVGGVCAQEAAQTLREFFRIQRAKKKEES